MGVADIVPGVSGGTIAFITGIYEKLISTISSFDQNFFKRILSFKFKEAFSTIDYKFLLNLFLGIISAILLTSRVVHFLLDNYSIYTWSFFFGLILSSILFLLKKVKDIKSAKALSSLLVGAAFGYLIVSLNPAQTPETIPFIFISGMIAICAMILPGVSGSFLLLVMGKYSFITGALKNPLLIDNFITVITFCCGCLLGLVSFSKFIKWSLKKHYNVMMALLTGFMIGSLQKVWPWKITLKTVTIREKVHILEEANFLPSLNSEAFVAFTFMFIGFILVQILERSNRGVSSAG